MNIDPITATVVISTVYMVGITVLAFVYRNK